MLAVGDGLAHPRLDEAAREERHRERSAPAGLTARETIARFCALDLRPQTSPPHSFRPASIARQPGMLLVEAEDRFLLLFGWALAEYMWTVVADAARPFGGSPIGIDGLNNDA